MTEKEAASEINSLRELIKKHERLYYVLDAPEITDAEFDALMNRLKSLEAQFPSLVSPDSPTSRVGGIAVSNFSPVGHEISMLSLDNCYSPEEFSKWYERILSNIGNFDCVIEAKIDGLSCSIEYKDGLFFRASTRGDGKIGEDVTANVRTINCIPLSIPLAKGSYLEVRGEVYMDKKEFERINSLQSNSSLPLFANPRNAAAGSLRQKSPEITAQRGLKFFVHSSGSCRGIDIPSSHWEYLEFCQKLGFPVTKVRKICKNLDEIISFYIEYETKRFELPYEIDGLVVKVDSASLRNTLGFTAKSPRWAIAFKYPAQQVKTKVKNVSFSVGRTGIITPVAELEPVKCGGVIISNSTLHNFDEVKRLNLKIGDIVLIERAGEVIPKVVRVLKEERQGGEIEIKEPEFCPSCNSRVYKSQDEVALRCINPSCPAQIKRALFHFASRAAMNIEGLGESIINILVDRKMVLSFSDIYNLTKEDLLTLPLFKDKKAENILKEIQESKKRNLDKLIFGLGIRHVGEKLSLILAERFFNMDNLILASFENLSSIEEVGPIIADSIVKFFSQESVKNLILKLKEMGLNMSYISNQSENRKLKGMTFVFTGELKSMTRQQAGEKVISLGGKESSSVSAKTSYVVVGENPGSKFEKAKKLGIKIINEEEFMKLISMEGDE